MEPGGITVAGAAHARNGYLLWRLTAGVRRDGEILQSALDWAGDFRECR
jgi:hypothetical protein